MEVVSENSPQEAEARAWLNGHKEESGLSWPQIGKLTDVASSTLSLFAAGKYAGNNAGVAAKVLAYRDRKDSQAQIAADAPNVPDWYDTPTSQRLMSRFRWAQSGKMGLIVTRPGIGKTMAAERFAAHDPNVWLATMLPSTAGVGPMAIEVGEAIGLGEIKGSPQQLSRQIKAHVRGKNGLLIIDEAQELTDKAVNELRGWHDQTKVGIVLMGNESVIGQITRGGSAFTQVSSRFSFRELQDKPRPGDIEALLDAWNIHDPAQRVYLEKVSELPGALREVTHIIEIALVAASGLGRALALADLKSATLQRKPKGGRL